MCILMSSNYLIFKSFSFEVIYSLVWQGLTKSRLGFSKHVNRVYRNFSKCKNLFCIKVRPWWGLTMLYSNFFIWGLLLPSLTKSNIGFFRKYTLTGPEMVSDAKVMNTKFVPLIKKHIWRNSQRFIWDGLDHSKFEISNFHGTTHVFGTLDGPNSESHEYQVCSTHQDLHLIHRTFLHLTKRYESAVLNPCPTCSFIKSMCDSRLCD